MLIAAAAIIFVRQPMHAAVWLITSLIALARDFYLLGSPLIAVLQIILYVGAIMILYVFFIMMNPFKNNLKIQRPALLIPSGLLIILVAEVVYLLYLSNLPLNEEKPIIMIQPEALGMVLFGQYKIAVEVISTLLLVALITVMYLARPFAHRKKKK
ncbi:MAG: NADH-quinone oxidoreductase subunit J [Endozoicomonadaceae bacterium]|nr:NADH-quinone oxidoreductase subunit J [Endozoicomonadaceae bacterium]